jgi:hypothetical protein
MCKTGLNLKKNVVLKQGKLRKKPIAVPSKHQFYYRVSRRVFIVPDEGKGLPSLREGRKRKGIGGQGKRPVRTPGDFPRQRGFIERKDREKISHSQDTSFFSFRPGKKGHKKNTGDTEN